jgi:hypothetical protein
LLQERFKVVSHQIKTRQRSKRFENCQRLLGFLTVGLDKFLKLSTILKS